MSTKHAIGGLTPPEYLRFRAVILKIYELLRNYYTVFCHGLKAYYLKRLIQHMLDGPKRNSACEKVSLIQVAYIIHSLRMFIIGPYEILALRYDRF